MSVMIDLFFVPLIPSWQKLEPLFYEPHPKAKAYY